MPFSPQIVQLIWVFAAFAIVGLLLTDRRRRNKRLLLYGVIALVIYFGLLVALVDFPYSRTEFRIEWGELGILIGLGVVFSWIGAFTNFRVIQKRKDFAWNTFILPTIASPMIMVLSLDRLVDKPEIEPILWFVCLAQFYIGGFFCEALLQRFNLGEAN